MSISVDHTKLAGDVSLRSVLDNITEPAVIAAMDGEILSYNRQFHTKVPDVVCKENIQQLLNVRTSVYETENIIEIATKTTKRTGLFPIQLFVELENCGVKTCVPGYISALRYKESRLPAAMLVQLDEHLIKITSRLKALQDAELVHAKKARIASLKATTDDLTGLKNRRFLNTFLKYQWHATKRSSEDAVIILFDIDHFKKINDVYGHNVGDVALKKFASCLEEEARAADIVGRWGGEEFLVILTHCKEDEAELYLYRAMKKLKERAVKIDQQMFIMTASAGFCPLSKAQSPEDAISKADKALYRAKNNGRNQFIKYV